MRCFQINDNELGFLRFYKFLKQALEGISFLIKPNYIGIKGPVPTLIRANSSEVFKPYELKALLEVGTRAMTKTNDTEQNDVKLCLAKTRSGFPCQKHPIAGRTRCRLHGGQARGPELQKVRLLALQRTGNTDDGLKLTLRRESKYGRTYDM